MFSKINTILVTIDAYVWGIPLIVLILSVGLFLTIRLKGVQFTNLGRAFKYIFKDETDGKHGEVSSFAALCTALSATIGTGNIVGVATAIVSGGPGALFWMWLAASHTGLHPMRCAPRGLSPGFLFRCAVRARS